MSMYIPYFHPCPLGAAPDLRITRRCRCHYRVGKESFSSPSVYEDGDDGQGAISDDELDTLDEAELGGVPQSTDLMHAARSLSVETHRPSVALPLAASLFACEKLL